MTFQELLDELAGVILRDRSALVSGPSDRLWEDDVLLRYIDDAQRRFARRSLCLRDNSTARLTQVALLEGEKEYALEPEVVAVLSAKYDTDTKDLYRLNHGTLAGDYQPPSDAWYGWSPNATLVSPGRPNGFWTDEAVRNGASRALIRLDNQPTANEGGKIIYLRVCRLPLVSATTDTLEDECELPEDYQLDMLDWAAYRALRNHDVDTELRQKADSHKERFKEAVEEARRDMLKKLFAEIGWGFGRNGFAWVGNQ